MFRSRSAVIRLLLPAALALAAVTAPSAAHAWWRCGVYFDFPPVVIGPAAPAYYYPPYYPPPYYAPPPGYAPAAGQACYAGPYVCPLESPLAVGAPCSCPTNDGRAGGRAG